MRTIFLRLFIMLFFLSLIYSCTDGKEEPGALPDLPGGIQAISLLGDTLYSSPFPEDIRLERERQLADAQAEFDNRPDDTDAVIWLGRRTAYLGLYRKAIKLYTKGLLRHPGDARLFRHRGHRYITIRQFDLAIADFEKAVKLIQGTEDEIEPDGMPNVRNIPTSTLFFNIWYHLGLAHYLKGDLESALKAYRECMKVSDNPDALVATSHWLYMTLRRLGHGEEAARVLELINANMDIIENGSYHRLLLLYKGEVQQDDLLNSAADALDNATMGYGIGNYHYYMNRREESKRMFRRVVEGSQWAAFGYIAAEAELSRF